MHCAVSAGLSGVALLQFFLHLQFPSEITPPVPPIRMRPCGFGWALGAGALVRLCVRGRSSLAGALEWRAVRSSGSTDPGASQYKKKTERFRSSILPRIIIEGQDAS